MTLSILPKKVTRAVKLLTDPRPGYVSMVRNAATQTPFRSIKTVAPQTFAEGSTQKDTAMADQTAPSVRSLSFKKNYFPDAVAVKKWLDEGGWDGFEIVEKGNYYYVEGEGATDEMFSGLKVVKIADGVVANIGKLTDEASAGAAIIQDDAKKTAAPARSRVIVPSEKGAVRNVRPLPTKMVAATKAEATPPVSEEVITKHVHELTKKWSYWEVYSSSEIDLSGVVEDAMEDGVPPGTGEIFNAMQTAVANTLKSEELDTTQKRAALTLIGSQFASIVYAMYEVFSTILDADESVQASIKSDKPKTLGWMNDMANMIKTEGKTLTQKMDTYGDQEGKITPKDPATGEGDDPNSDGGALDPDNKKDKITLDPAHGLGADATTAGGKTGTDTAAVKATAEEPEEVKKAREILAQHEAATKTDIKPKPVVKTDSSTGLTLGNLKTMIADAVDGAVTKHVAPLMNKIDELEGTVTATKADTDALVHRAPTRKSAPTGGAEETLTPATDVAKKAAAEEEATRKSNEKFRRNALGIF